MKTNVVCMPPLCILFRLKRVKQEQGNYNLVQFSTISYIIRVLVLCILDLQLGLC